MCEEGASKFYSEENEDDEDEEADFSEDLVSEDIIGLSAPTKEKEGRTISVKLDKAEPIGEAGGEVANPVPSLNNEYGSGLGTFEKLESEEDYPSVEVEAETESAPMSPNQLLRFSNGSWTQVRCAKMGFLRVAGYILLSSWQCFAAFFGGLAWVDGSHGFG
ncbi:hypothetical protein U1Q18_040340 [Sarracenia purpurea var. burkii]